MPGESGRGACPYGITGDDIVDVFNVFMHVDQDNDGNFTIEPSIAREGDYILAAISACPADATPTNGYRPKPLGVKILAGER